MTPPSGTAAVGPNDPRTASARPACYADAAAFREARIVRHVRIAENAWRVRLDCPEIAAVAAPGQFAMLRIPGRNDPLLARPLAVYDCLADDVDPGRGDAAAGSAAAPLRYVDFIYAVHGRFTTALKEIPPGSDLVVWGPLGNGFRIPPVEHLVLVAGGIGQTALLLLGREHLRAAHRGGTPRSPAAPTRVTFCWGARHAGLFGGLDDFRSSGVDVHMATLDGSAGLRGTVVDLLDALFGADARPHDPPVSLRIACCGPDPMMAAVARWAAARRIDCDVSLEAPMACGIGICFTCVARVRDDDGGWDYRRTCVEGPVFDATRIEW
jgi:dihydroorotate dehydrogenase electron transfer subunit